MGQATPSKPAVLAPQPYELAYWEALKKQELLIQRCLECGASQLYPRIVCKECQSRTLDWVESSGEGTVYSYSVVSRSPAAFSNEVPYVLAVVELEEGARIATRIVGSSPSSVSIGAPVKVTFEEFESGRVWPLFHLAE